jgi:hypothetical protein
MKHLGYFAMEKNLTDRIIGNTQSNEGLRKGNSDQQNAY